MVDLCKKYELMFNSSIFQVKKCFDPFLRDSAIGLLDKCVDIMVQVKDFQRNIFFMNYQHRINLLIMKKIRISKISHSSCCACEKCKFHYDDCQYNEAVEDILKEIKNIQYEK